MQMLEFPNPIYYTIVLKLNTCMGAFWIKYKHLNSPYVVIILT